MDELIFSVSVDGRAVSVFRSNAPDPVFFVVNGGTVRGGLSVVEASHIFGEIVIGLRVAFLASRPAGQA